MNIDDTGRHRRHRSADGAAQPGDRPHRPGGAGPSPSLEPGHPGVAGHLAAVDFPYSPRLVGQEPDADLLSYLPGASGVDGWAPAAETAGRLSAAKLLRANHQAVTAWRPEAGPVWFTGQEGIGGPSEIVCHGDSVPGTSSEVVRRLAAEGHRRQVDAVAGGALREIDEQIAWSEGHRSYFR